MRMQPWLHRCWQLLLPGQRRARREDRVLNVRACRRWPLDYHRNGVAVAEPGVTVDLIRVDTHLSPLADIRPGHDLYVLRTVNDTALSLARILERQGARCINSAMVSWTCRDKAVVTSPLGRAGIRVPQTWLAGQPSSWLPYWLAGLS